MPQRPLYAADVKEALQNIQKVVNGQILENLVNAMSWVPDNTKLADDVTAGLGASAGSTTPVATTFQPQTPVTLVAKC